MSVLGNLFIALAKVIDLVVGMYTFIIAGAVIITWVQADPYNPIVRFLRTATEPVFSRVRKLLPKSITRGNIDWTPMIVIIALIFFQTLLSGVLMDLGLHLRYGDRPPLP